MKPTTLTVVAVASVWIGVVGARRVGASRRTEVSAAALASATARGDLLLRVPHAPGEITLDGDTDDPGWLRPPGPARTYDFLSGTGRPARPHSEARVVWGGDYLYLALYAADEDIECKTDRPDVPLGDDDAFRVEFTRPGIAFAIDVTPRAILSGSVRHGDGAWQRGWSSGAHASREMDGTLNDPANRDEEWAIELAVPFEAIGMRGEPGESIGMTLSRCDVAKGTLVRSCAAWGDGTGGRGRGRIVLE